MTPATATEIPLFDLRVERDDLAAVEAVYRSGALAMGERVEAFERAFAERVGARHAVAVSSCTAALHLAYLAAGVGPGDEVIVPSYTFAATANAAIYCGATPRFADIAGSHDLSIDAAHVEGLIGPRTKAVVAVHFAGYAAPVDELARLCESHGIALLEDAAHGPGATLGGRGLGTLGLAGAFSFFSNKVLPCGEGGLVATDDDEVAAAVRARRSPSVHAGGAPGFNYRMDEPRAAFLLSRLGRLEDDLADRRRLVRRYREALAGLVGLELPYRDADVEESSCYVMPVMLTEPGRQAPLRRALRSERGIHTSLLYPAVHEFTAYRERFGALSLPRTELAARCEVTLPLYPHMTPAEQDRVVDALRASL